MPGTSLRYLSVFILIFSCAGRADAQGISFRDTVDAYLQHTIRLNIVGNTIRGGWGAANLAAGSIGYCSGARQETRYFCEMSAIGGAVNLGVSVISFIRLNRELSSGDLHDRAYDYYRSSKRSHLLSAGVDVVCIGVGVGLAAGAPGAGKNRDVYSGFGKSMVIQGVIQLLSDNIIFSAQQLDNSKWFRIMDEIRFTNRSVGFVHTF